MVTATDKEKRSGSTVRSRVRSGSLPYLDLQMMTSFLAGSTPIEVSCARSSSCWFLHHITRGKEGLIDSWVSVANLIIINIEKIATQTNYLLMTTTSTSPGPSRTRSRTHSPKSCTHTHRSTHTQL